MLNSTVQEVAEASTQAAALTQLQERLTYRFRDPQWLQQACTHTSYMYENKHVGADYERLEFVGDAVLALLVSALLWQHFPQLPEGELSQRRAQVVCQTSLAELAAALQLSHCARLGGSQLSGSMAKKILADMFEAVLGAVFIDGGYSAAWQTFTPRLEAAVLQTQAQRDFKSQLQELCQAQGLALPIYRVTHSAGPDHARQFFCEVEVRAQCVGSGSGSSKRVAEQSCAQQALVFLA